MLHFDYKNSNSIITVSVVAFAVFCGGITLAGYIAGSSRVKQIVIETALDVKLDDGNTIRNKFKLQDEKNIKLDYGIETAKNQCMAYEPRIGFLEHWLDAPTKKGRK